MTTRSLSCRVLNAVGQVARNTGSYTGAFVGARTTGDTAMNGARTMIARNTGSYRGVFVGTRITGDHT